MNAEVLNTPIEYLKGVGPKRADVLKSELLIYTFRDLLCHFPFRYIDRSTTKLVKDISESSIDTQVIVQITSVKEVGQPRRKRLVAAAKDETGTIQLVLFKGIKWIKPTLQVGQQYVVFGKPNIYGGSWNFNHPEMELEIKSKGKIGVLQPVYHSGEKTYIFWLKF